MAGQEFCKLLALRNLIKGFLNICMCLFKGHPHLMTRFDGGHQNPRNGNWHLSTTPGEDMQMRSCCQNRRILQNDETKHLVINHKMMHLQTAEHTQIKPHAKTNIKSYSKQNSLSLMFSSREIRKWEHLFLCISEFEKWPHGTQIFFKDTMILKKTWKIIHENHSIHVIKHVRIQVFLEE